jgi:hypothetical protein
VARAAQPEGATGANAGKDAPMSRAPLHVISFAIAAALSSAPAGAQIIPWLEPQRGRVRISSPTLVDGKHEGRVISAVSDQIVIQLNGRTDSVTFRRGELSSLERSEGTQSRGRRGMAIGFLTGAVVGAISGANYEAQCDTSVWGVARCEEVIRRNANTNYAASHAMGTGVLGLLVGGGIGLLVRSERWVPVERAHWASRVSPAAPTSGGAGMRIAF